MSKRTAWEVQCAVMIGLLGGLEVPPLRLSTIKSCRQQGYMGGCLDKDCPNPAQCRGNRIELQGKGEDMTLEYVAPHHKNEGKGRAKAICVTIPKGDLFDLTCLHIKKGHRILTLTSLSHQSVMFVTKYGNPFQDSPFSNWFKTQIIKVRTCHAATLARCFYYFLLVSLMVEWAQDNSLISQSNSKATHIFESLCLIWDCIHQLEQVCVSLLYVSFTHPHYFSCLHHTNIHKPYVFSFRFYMQSGMGIFPPSKVRTMFVEHYIREFRGEFFGCLFMCDLQPSLSCPRTLLAIQVHTYQ